MSWLVSSIANSLKLDNDEEEAAVAGTASTTIDAGDKQPSPHGDQNHNSQIDSSPSSSPRDPQTTPRRGVKEDFSELSKTLTRQFWGVASFLAPPPQISDLDRDPNLSQQPSDQSDKSSLNSSETAAIAGIRNDLSEIGGKFRTGISKLSSNKTVSELTKIASNLLQFGSEEDESLEDYAQRGVVGVTEEVVAFARDVALHPETWLDFPLPDDDDEEEEDFDMSDTQQEHALAVEHLAPRLAALRIELCPGYMSEGSFWKIYFVLVHPRLSKHDALLLSTPQIMKARAMLTQELQNRAKPKPSNSGVGDTSVGTTNSTHEEDLSVPQNDQSKSVPIEMSALEPATSSEAAIFEMDKHPVISTEIPIIDKAVVEEVSVRKTSNEMPTSSSSKDLEVANYEDDGDDWLKEETPEMGVSGTTIPLGNDEDVSFSDLEDDDGDVNSSYKTVMYSDSSAKDSRDWVQLGSGSAASSKDASTINVEHRGSGKVSGSIHENKESSDWLDFDDLDSA
ncbi:hypothetical protein Ancab_003922 [Ancistrocladus abbreviatus]